MSGLTVRDNTIEGSTAGKPVVGVTPIDAAIPDDITIELNRIHQLSTGDGIYLFQTIGSVVVQDNEITGSGSRYGVHYELTNADGIVREDAIVSGNVIEGFDDIGIRFRAEGAGKFGNVTACANDVSGSGIGLRLELVSAAHLIEADVCNNMWAPDVTTPVSSNRVTHFRGTGSPEGVVAAPVGSDFIRTDEANRLFVKQSGTGTTGWVGT